jgi:carbamate kinase
LQSEAYPKVRPYPLDVLGAESEGMIGYLLDQALQNELPDRHVATLRTQVVVDPDDPAFAAPTKPVGPVYSEAEARRLAAERDWTVSADGRWWRRVVASPEPWTSASCPPSGC